jgi:hypothetical protein
MTSRYSSPLILGLCGPPFLGADLPADELVAVITRHTARRRRNERVAFAQHDHQPKKIEISGRVAGNARKREDRAEIGYADSSLPQREIEGEPRRPGIAVEKRMIEAEIEVSADGLHHGMIRIPRQSFVDFAVQPFGEAIALATAFAEGIGRAQDNLGLAEHDGLHLAQERKTQATSCLGAGARDPHRLDHSGGARRVPAMIVAVDIGKVRVGIGWERAAPQPVEAFRQGERNPVAGEDRGGSAMTLKCVAHRRARSRMRFNAS